MSEETNYSMEHVCGLLALWCSDTRSVFTHVDPTGLIQENMQRIWTNQMTAFVIFKRKGYACGLVVVWDK